jgi:hypothetical protein
MLKRIAVAGASLVAALALIAAMASASAQASICLKLSNIEEHIKEGQYTNPDCEGDPTPNLLEGDWVLVEELTAFKREDLWCAKLRLVLPGGISGEDGYFKTDKCEADEKLGDDELNASDWTEVVFPSGLPDMSVTLSGGVYPINMEGSRTSATTSLGTASGVTLSGTGVTLALETTELSALGTFKSTFTKVKSSEGIECNTAGDAKGVVLVKGEFHLVPINLSPLSTGTLFLVSEAEIECPGGVNVVVRGALISSLNGIGSETTELTGFGGELKGSKGKQNLSEYYNVAGTKVKAKLESEAGVGFVMSDENISEEVKLTVEGSKMLVITGR